jgi:peptide/nickel transport system permease protein
VATYVVKRLLGGCVVLFIVTVMMFAVMRSLGNPVVFILGQDYNAALGARLTRQLGLNHAWYVQYVQWLAQLLRGNLGVSYVYHQSVTYLIGQALPVTIELTVLAMLLAAAVGLPVGVVVAMRRGSWLDRLVDVLTTGAAALPNFFLGILLILLFSLLIPVLPSTGYVQLWSHPLINLRDMILPCFTLSLYYAANMARITRTAMLDVLSAQFVVTARSKGLVERRVVYVHALRNALIPLITLMGLNVGPLLGGAVVVESVFRLPGMGTLLVNGIMQMDLPVVQGAVLVAVVAVVITNILVDLAYCVADPRVRVE